MLQSDPVAATEIFEGFQPLDASFVYCPNQFLDHCITTQSRSVVRLASYILYQTLRWMDDDGNPITNDIPVSFNNIVNQAGVSRGSARATLDACQQQRFIVCVQAPKQKRSGSPGRVGEYQVVWNDKFTEPFEGFYGGDGRRTPIPHAFFTDVIPKESLAVTRVVAAVIRNTAGYTANQFGGRRKQATLSYSMLQSCTNLSRDSLAIALKLAVDKGFIVVHERGVFDSNQHKQSASTYGLRWHQDAKNSRKGSKNLPGKHRTVQKADQKNSEGFKKLTRKGSKVGPEEGFKKLTSIKETRKEHTKQQQVVVEFDESIERLTAVGFEASVATELSQKRSQQEIQNQIEWMPKRHVRSNALGLLRKAIEENWAKPFAKFKRKAGATEMPKRTTAADDVETRQQERRKLRQIRLARWMTLDSSEQQRLHKKAAAEARTAIEHRRLQRHCDSNNPPNVTLAVMADTFSDYH